MKTNFYRMNIIRLFTVIVFLLVGLVQVKPYSYLTVIDPRQGWSTSGRGTIEEATFFIEPKGVYAECQMHLTFSAKGLDFNANDTIEVQFNFSLPNGSLVTNSHLLIGDSLVEARLLDRWTATQI